MKNDLLQKLLKNSPTKHASVMSDSVFFNDKDVIPTDIPIINVAFSGELDGGLTSGLTLLAGPSKSYKSLLSLVCARAYLNKYKDAVAVLYDSEGGMTPEYLSAQGIDPSRVLHVPIEHLEMLKYDMVKQLNAIERGDKVIFIIDSIGNTGSLKELQDALEEKTVAEMTRAKTIKGLFRVVTPSLVAKDVPCITICHTYSTMETYSKQIISGGTGLIYSANQAFIIGKAQEKDGTDLAGWNFTLNVEKSRFTREKSKFTFQVLYDSGIQKYSGLLDLALESGHMIKPKMGWYQTVNVNTGEVSERNYRAKDLVTDSIWDPILSCPKFKEFIKRKFQFSTNYMDQEDSYDEALSTFEEE